MTQPEQVGESDGGHERVDAEHDIERPHIERHRRVGRYETCEPQEEQSRPGEPSTSGQVPNTWSDDIEEIGHRS